MAHMRISGTTKATELIPTAFAFTHRVYKKTFQVEDGREPSNFVAWELRLLEKVSLKCYTLYIRKWILRN